MGLDGGKGERPQEEGAGPPWPQGQGLCQVWVVDLERRGESSGPATPASNLRSQQPYRHHRCLSQRPRHGRELCECSRV